MDRKRFGLKMIVLFLALGMFVKCFATEQVVRMTTICGNGRGCVAFTIANSYGPSVEDKANATNAHTFTVYTTAEIDGQIQPLQKNQSDDDAQIQVLKKDIKALSDANDALTKRLNALEAKLNDRSATP